MFEVDSNFLRAERDYLIPPETDDYELKFICDWCENEVDDLECNITEDKNGDYHGVCKDCIKKYATVENALAYSDAVFGKKEYDNTLIAALYTQEELLEFGRKDLQKRLAINYAPDVEKIKHAVEFYCLEESDSFIDFVVNNKKKA